MIPDTVLQKYGGRLIRLEKGSCLFREDDTAGDFFIVRQGHIRRAT